MTEKPQEESTGVLSGLTDKTTIANVVAAVAVVVGIVGALWKGDLVLVQNLTFIGAGYLFGATAAKANGK